MRRERLFLLPALLFLAVFLVQAAGAIWHNSLGFDLPFHLANGREILLRGTIPHDDPFLAPLGGDSPHHFPNYEWLFGVAVWSLFQAWGFEGVEILRLALIAGIFLCLGLATWTRSGTDLPGPDRPPGHSLALRLALLTLVLIIGFAAAGRRFEPRPHLVSGFGLAFFAVLLRPARPHSMIFGPALLFGLAWANAHIEVLLGLGFCLLDLVVCSLTRFAGRRGEGDSPAPALAGRILLAIGLLGAILASPASWRMFTQARDYYSRLGTIMEKYQFVNIEIVPIEPSWWHQPFGILFWLAWAGLLIGLASPRRRESTIRSLSVVPFWLMPFLSNRYLLPAVVFLVPAAMDGLLWLVERLPGRWRAGAMIIALPLALLGVLPTLGNPRPPHPEAGFAQEGPLAWHRARVLPEGAVRFLRQNRIGGSIFCPDRWGNHLLFTSRIASGSRPLFPFIHNMNQTYSMVRLDEYLQILRRPEEAPARLASHGIDLVLLALPEHRRDEQFHLSHALRRSGAWHLVFWDDLSIVYAHRRVVEANPHLEPFTTVDPALFVLDEMALHRLASGSTRLDDELERARVASAGVEVLNTSLWLAGRRENRGDREGAIAALRELQKRLPHAWPILAKLGLLLHQNGHEAAGISTLELARAENPHHAPLLYNLAVAYLKAGQADLALRRLDESRAADPEFEPARELEKRIAAP